MPLDIHKDAPAAHAASVAAQRQGKFWEYHDKLFSNQKNLKVDDLRRYASELGLDLARFERDMADPEIKKAIESDKAEAAAIGVTGTPGFFVNGLFLSGAKPFEEFAKLINVEMAKLNLPIPEAAKVQ